MSIKYKPKSQGKRKNNSYGLANYLTSLVLGGAVTSLIIGFLDLTIHYTPSGLAFLMTVCGGLISLALMRHFKSTYLKRSSELTLLLVTGILIGIIIEIARDSGPFDHWTIILFIMLSIVVIVISKYRQHPALGWLYFTGVALTSVGVAILLLTVLSPIREWLQDTSNSFWYSEREKTKVLFCKFESDSWNRKLQALKSDSIAVRLVDQAWTTDQMLARGSRRGADIGFKRETGELALDLDTTLPGLRCSLTVSALAADKSLPDRNLTKITMQCIIINPSLAGIDSIIGPEIKFREDIQLDTSGNQPILVINDAPEPIEFIRRLAKNLYEVKKSQPEVNGYIDPQVINKIKQGFNEIEGLRESPFHSHFSRGRKFYLEAQVGADTSKVQNLAAAAESFEKSIQAYESIKGINNRAAQDAFLRLAAVCRKLSDLSVDNIKWLEKERETLNRAERQVPSTEILKEYLISLDLNIKHYDNNKKKKRKSDEMYINLIDEFLRINQALQDSISSPTSALKEKQRLYDLKKAQLQMEQRKRQYVRRKN